MSTTSLEGTTLVRSRSKSPAVVSTRRLDDAYVITACRAEGVEVRIGERAVPLTPGRFSAVLSPGLPVSLQIVSGAELDCIHIERARLEAHLVSLIGRSCHRLVFTPRLDLGEPGASSVVALMTLLFDLAHHLYRFPMFLTHLRDAFLTGLLTALPHSASHLLEGPVEGPVGGIAPASVRRAEAYMAAHAREPITLADIVMASGASTRSLQVAFQRFRGSRPLDFLRERRLELAREALLAAAPGTSVAAIAASLQFGGSEGRFSGRYRQRFGESPSETLRRARQRPRP